MIVPIREYFPPPYSGSDAEVSRVVRAVAGFMGVQVQIEVDFSSDMDRVQTLQRMVPGGMTRSSGAAGAYSQHHCDRKVISVDLANVGQPARLIAVIAHELGHVRLLGERRIRADRKDSEPLTDLVTVYLGMGIFTANAAFDFSSTPRAKAAFPARPGPRRSMAFEQ